MKKILAVVSATVLLAACSHKPEPGKFVVHGKVQNMADQKVYLDEIYFSPQDPQVLDTAEVHDGKFTVTGIAPEEGLYRLRFEKQGMGYVFINDKPELDFKADAKDISLQGPDFNSPANAQFKNFLTIVDGRQKALQGVSTEIDSLKTVPGNDSLLQVKTVEANTDATSFKQFVLKSVDTVSDPIIALFALGYARTLDPALLQPIVTKLPKRFPNNHQVAGVVAAFNAMMTQPTSPPASSAKPGAKPGIGDLAPEITMTDTSGKPFSLSSLRGKYVLVDFWASWCMPCRGENPNVVATYNRFKNKNLAIVGVSLDDNRAQWLKAIRADKLAWTQVSDLKGWANAAADKYGFDGIPYNVLIDPQGKIIATELRGSDLGDKLAELFK